MNHQSQNKPIILKDSHNSATDIHPRAFKWPGASSLVLGVLSLVAGWTLVVPVAGLVLGFGALEQNPASKNIATAGLVLNGLMLIGWVTLLIIFLSSEPPTPQWLR